MRSSMNNKIIFIPCILVLFISLISCGSSTEVIGEITYKDDYISITCNITMIYYDGKVDSTYVIAELLIQNVSIDKHLILNLDNLYLYLDSDTSRHTRPHHPNASIIIDKLYTLYEQKREVIYWDFDNNISDEKLLTGKLFYRYNDPKMTNRLKW